MTIPLAPLSVRLFREAVAACGSRARVFGVPIRKMNEIVRDAAGITDITLHDLRRSCSSGLQRLGCPPHVISVVLGHVREEGATMVDSVYMHDRRVSEHRTWLEKWAEHIEGLLAGRGELNAAGPRRSTLAMKRGPRTKDGR